MGTYSIKQLHKENFDILIPLMLDCFGMDTDIDYFKWKFVNNPAGEVQGYYALYDERNEVAAYYGVIPELYIIDGKEQTIYQSCDTMTHSNHRRKGLFKMLANHCYDELRRSNQLFIIGFSGEMSTPGFIKFGWRHIFDMRYYFVPRISLLPSSNREDENVHPIKDYSLIQNLILCSNDSANIHSHKTLEFYNWRISNPLRNYDIIAYWNGLDYESYLTYYIDKDKIFLFDFDHRNTRALKKLVGALKKKVNELKLKGIVAFVQEHSLFTKALKKVGFISNPFSKGPLSAKGPFIIYGTEDVLDRYSDRKKWLISALDHDAM